MHLAGIYLAGLGLALPLGWALSRARGSPRRGRLYLLAAGTLVALLLVPLLAERRAYLARNAAWMEDSRAALAAEEPELAALVAWLEEAPPGRVYAGRPANWGGDYRVGAVPVYALLQRAGFDMLGYLYHALSLNADVQVLFDESRPEHYNLFNVRYVVAPPDRAFPDFVRPVGDYGRHRLYQVETSGYFDLVASDLAFAGDRDAFYPAASAWLASFLPAVKQHPAIDLGGEGTPGPDLLPLSAAADLLASTPLGLPAPSGRILSERVSAGAFSAAVDVPQDSMVLLKATYHPNWRATVDGVEAETVMLMPSFVGVKVPPGAHEIHLEYRSRPLRGVLLVLGLLVLAALAGQLA